MSDQIEELQSRIAFQEQTIDELTRGLVDQQKEIYEIRVMLEHLHKQLKAVERSDINHVGEEPAPPHY